MVVQHFVFLSLPWQLRRTSEAGERGLGHVWVVLQQRTLLLVAGGAFIFLWVFAESLLGLLGERFVAVADIFRIFVFIRFIDLLWGPNHELLVSNGLTVRDAHANILALAAWLVVFVSTRSMNIEIIPAAVCATALAALAGQASRYQMIRSANLIPRDGP